MEIKYEVEFELTDTNKRFVDFVSVSIEDVESDAFIREILYDKLNEKYEKHCVGDCAPYCECDDAVEVDNLTIKNREFINL